LLLLLLRCSRCGRCYGRCTTVLFSTSVPLPAERAAYGLAETNETQSKLCACDRCCAMYSRGVEVEIEECFQYTQS
jgi:hypothetical protein